MVKELRCRDVGFDCDAVVIADDEDDILREVVDHAREVHHLTDEQLADPQLVELVRAQTFDRDASI